MEIPKITKLEREKILPPENRFRMPVKGAKNNQEISETTFLKRPVNALKEAKKNLSSLAARPSDFHQN